ncbi:hypothetical protein BDF14DRAFT_1373640 [Spinellus fusiger]|nr:hypothetical protein BDF14DRAFT_1373640 [Spinellus fusiger]
MTRDTEALESSIRQVTETGEWLLDVSATKFIKGLCKRSHENVEIAFTVILSQCQKKQSQIRYSCLQLIEILFQRSHHFRLLLTKEFPMFLQLTVGIQQHTLPPPQQVAIEVGKYAIALVKNWQKSHGNTLRPIDIGYDYLVHHGFLDPDTGGSLPSIHLQNRDRAEENARKKVIQERRMVLLKKDIEEHLSGIQENIKSMQTCFFLLVPKITQEDTAVFDALLRGDVQSDKRPEESYSQSVQSHGLGSNRYRITIDMSEESMMEDVKETPENNVLYEQLRDSHKSLEKRHKQQVNRWMSRLSSLDTSNKREKEDLLKRLIDIKMEMEDVSRKSHMLGVQIKVPHQEVKDESQEVENEFENELFEQVQVPEIALEKTTDAALSIGSTLLPPSQRIFPLSYEPRMIEDVTYRGIHTIPLPQRQEPKEDEEEDLERKELLARAPIVEWGDDLYYWDKTHIEFNTSGLEKSHSFMGIGQGTNEIPDHLLQNLKKRHVFYKHKTPETIRACNAPLHSGKLCPRRDLVTCPFHGTIIPRNAIGEPLKDPFYASTSASASASATPTPVTTTARTPHLWQEIESDVMQQTGQRMLPLARPSKKPKHTALINVRNPPTSSYHRLEKKLKGPAMRRSLQAAADNERQLKALSRDTSEWKE